MPLGVEGSPYPKAGSITMPETGRLVQRALVPMWGSWQHGFTCCLGFTRLSGWCLFLISAGCGSRARDGRGDLESLHAAIIRSSTRGNDDH